MRIYYDIKGYEGIYQLSKDGKVLSKARQGAKTKVLKGARGEYLCVHLTKNGKTKKKRIHRLLAEMFIPNPDNKPQVNHKDGNKYNNSLENLEWVTNGENVKHAYDKGLIKPRRGELNGNSKLTEKQVAEIRDIASRSGRYYGRKELSLRYGVSECTIKEVVNRRRNNWSNC